MELACKNCGKNAEVTSFLAAAQTPCPHCGKLMMGDLMATSLKAPPASHYEPPPKPAGHPDAPRHRRTGPFNWTPLIVGALLGGILAMAFAVLGKGLDVSTQGTLLGLLAGVLAAPLIALGLFLAAVSAKLQGSAGLVPGVDEMMSESAMDSIATAVNEGRYGKLGCFLFVLIGVAMLIGAVLGSEVHGEAVSHGLVIAAVVGGVALGALIGVLATPYLPVSEPAVKDEPEVDAEKE